MSAATRVALEVARNPHAWPGGYPVFAVTSDGGALCPKCVRSEFREIAEACRKRLSNGWRIEASAINWEDPELFCDHCNKRIESAYAEDEVQS